MSLIESDPGAELIALLRHFLSRDMAASTFVENYQQAWRKWRDAPKLHILNRASANAFERAFTAADCYKPDSGNRSGRSEWDIGESELTAEISKILKDIEEH